MKLPNNMGSVAKLGGNRRRPYIVRVSTGWKYNQAKDKMEQERAIIGYARTRKEGLEMLTEYNMNPYNLEERNTTFLEVFTRWFEAYKSKGLSRSTYLAYSSAIKDLRPIWDRPIKDLKTKDLQNVLDHCGKNYPTIRKIKICIKQVYKYAIQYDITQKDYSAYIDISKHKSKNPNALDRTPFTQEEITTLWANKSDTYTQVLLIYIYTGLRASIKSFYYANDSDYLITTPQGEKLLYRNYYDAYFKPLMIRYNMNHHIHDTRHTCVSLLTLANIKEVTIKKIVGHSGAMSLTEKVYTHLDYKELLDAINAI